MSKLPSWDSVELKRDLMYKTILREKEIDTTQSYLIPQPSQDSSVCLPTQKLLLSKTCAKLWLWYLLRWISINKSKKEISLREALTIFLLNRALYKGLYAILLCTLISTFYDLSEDSKIFNVVSLKLFVHKIYLNSQYNSNESHISISLFEIY